jgi:hypothetical protein
MVHPTSFKPGDRDNAKIREAREDEDSKIVLEGFIEKRNRFYLYQKKRMVLTKDPRLIYYNNPKSPVIIFVYHSRMTLF